MLSPATLAAIEEARDAWRATTHATNKGRQRRRLETLLVRNVDELLAAARARMTGELMPPQERWTREVAK